MTTIGLPKGLFYFEHHILWERFFKNLGCDVITSQNTNKQILDYGVKCCSNETCLPVKVFHGHVFSLKDIVDYIFIPRYTSLDKNEYTCPKFCGLPDMAILNLKRQVKVLEVRIHADMFPSETFDSLIEISQTLNIKYADLLEAFKDASIVFDEYMQNRHKTNQYIKGVNNTKTALSVLGHPYMIYDSYLSMTLIDKLIRKSITVYTPKDIDHETKRRNAYPFQGKVFWDVGFELLGSAFTFAEDRNIKGLIYLTPFACGVDAFILEFIERRIKSHYNIPLLKLTIDEHTGEAGFDTRLEAFLDMVG
jgi:predicted nucleotide-binding protein (sugar kinase/HSP70/actin superfamily)